MSIFYSLIAAFFVVLFAYLISHSTNDKPKKRKAAVENAIQAGHTVTANLVKRGVSKVKAPGETDAYIRTIGYYEYSYNGKKYKYEYWSENPPATLDLYFVKNPSKATVAELLSPVTTNWPVVYIIVAVVLYFIVFR